MTTGLLIGHDTADDAALPAFIARMAARGVPVIALAAVGPDRPWWSAKAMLAACRAHGLESTTSWLACRDPAAIAAAGTAGLAGVVLIAVDVPTGEHACVVARAESLDDAPRVMIPRGGGCWHDHRG
jgi:hypothetical protein